jgi:hypothetical protein
MDKDKLKKQFFCEYCSEIFTTKQNLQRHITRKHKNIEQQQDDNISVLSTDTTIISINYQSETEHSCAERNDVPEIPKPESIPSDEYLINLRNEYMKYQHLYKNLDKKMKWDKNNEFIDMNFYHQKHVTKMRYILFKIALLKCNTI